MLTERNAIKSCDFQYQEGQHVSSNLLPPPLLQPIGGLMDEGRVCPVTNWMGITIDWLSHVRHNVFSIGISQYRKKQQRGSLGNRFKFQDMIN